MANMIRKALLGSSWLVAFFPSPGVAAQMDPEPSDSGGSGLSAEFSAGAEYDSNVSVNALDANTGEDDVAAIFDASLGFDRDFGGGTGFSAGYDFSQSLYATFSDFDVQSHIVSAGLTQDFGAFEIGGDYHLAYSRLGGDGFLTVHRLSPNIAKFFGKSLYIRAAYVYADKNFIGRTDRDAKSNAYGADAYLFLNGARTYFVGGYEREKENATDDQFDYKANNFKAKFVQRISLGENQGKFELGWRLEDRNYSSITPSIGVLRADKRNRLQAEIEIPLGRTFFANAAFEHGIYDSNLPSADYRQDLASLRLGARF